MERRSVREMVFRVPLASWEAEEKLPALRRRTTGGTMMRMGRSTTVTKLRKMAKLAGIFISPR
jgi:uncharacterized NAD-dependent epimerase/dehydratase family protein